MLRLFALSRRTIIARLFALLFLCGILAGTDRPVLAEPGILPFKPGVTAGGVIGALQTETLGGSSMGLYAQVEIGRLGFLAEMAKMSYESVERVDRLIAGGATLRLLSLMDVSLFLRATVGLNRPAVDGAIMADQIHGAAGGGVAVLLTRNLSATFEAFVAGRQTVRRHDDTGLPTTELVPDTETMTHLRLGLALSF